LLLANGKLYLAGGTAVSPAVYDITNGKCLNDPAPLRQCGSTSPRGWELFLIGDRVVASGKPFYSHPKYPVYDDTVTRKLLVASAGDRDIAWANNNSLLCFAKLDKERWSSCVAKRKEKAQYRIPTWGKLDVSEKPLWERACEGSVAVAVCRNGVVVADKSRVSAVNLQNGKVIWAQPLPCSPVPWGLAVDRDGRVIMCLEDGSVLCIGSA
jgi:hypothetical protein